MLKINNQEMYINFIDDLVKSANDMIEGVSLVKNSIQKVEIIIENSYYLKVLVHSI
jgi:hypothetical protein